MFYEGINLHLNINIDTMKKKFRTGNAVLVWTTGLSKAKKSIESLIFRIEFIFLILIKHVLLDESAKIDVDKFVLTKKSHNFHD